MNNQIITEVKEIWKVVPNYPNYYVSNTGKVKSIYKKSYGMKILILKQYLDRYGYLYVRLSNRDLNNKSKMINLKVHRLVAMCFLNNYSKDLQVNHIDENKLNNNVSNLEMCSNKYNCRYGSRRTKLAKPVIQETLEGKFVKEWISIREITRTLGYARACISACCKGVLKSSHTGKIYPVRHAYGYKWRFK